MMTLPSLAGWDWFVIALFFAITFWIGFGLSKRGTGSLMDYFIAGRKMTWWLAGTSIVATSFAADTPLVISGWMRTYGLEKNWFWWGGIMGMMLCTFFYARLWRRAGILTDVEFNELRYSGVPAASLRLFHATYRSIIQNTLVMGWVTLAMVKILDVTLNIPTLVFVHDQWLPVLVDKGVEVSSVLDPSQIVHWPILGEAIVPAKATGIIACFIGASAYTIASGMWGLMATDLFQFTFAMSGTVVLMVAVLLVSSGPQNLVVQARQAVNAGQIRNRVPSDRSTLTEASLAEAMGKDGVRSSATDGPTASEGGARRLAEQLASAGLLQSNSAAEGVWSWSADGVSEPQFVQRVDDLGLAAREKDAVVSQWRRAYTISEAVFSSSRVADKLIKSQIVVDDEPALGRRVSYYRISTLAWTEQQLMQRLDEAGINNKSEVMAAWRYDTVVATRKITGFLPPFDLTGGGLLAVWSLVVFLGLQWWAGGEGGGFLAQRLFSCKDEKHSVLAMLWYNLAHFALRPWPWIVVGIGSLFLIPDITAYGRHYDAEHAYVVMLMKYLPTGLRGMMVAALMAAYMSTISTHINFGASYVVNDIYKRFIHPDGSDRTNVMVSQVVSGVLAAIAGVYAFFLESISTEWFKFFELMSGAGFVVLLRWYWWRISAWSELAAMFSSLLMFCLLNYTHLFHGIFAAFGAPDYWLDEYAVRFTVNLVVSTMIWVTVTFLTPAEKEERLIAFYRRVCPAGWWRHIAIKAGNSEHLVVGWVEWVAWALGVTGLFATIFALGEACFGRYLLSLLWASYAVVATWFLFKMLGKMDWSSIRNPDEEPEVAACPAEANSVRQPASQSA